MQFLLKIPIKIAGYSLGLVAASSFIPGFTFTGDWRMLLAAGVILTVVHTVILPILKILTFPLALITFGLFHILLSAVILWAAIILIPGVHIESLASAAWAVIAIAVTGLILSFI